MIENLTTFDIAFPIGLGLMWGITRYARFLQAGLPDALNLAARQAVLGVAGAAGIILIYKFIGIL